MDQSEFLAITCNHTQNVIKIVDSMQGAIVLFRIG